MDLEAELSCGMECILSFRGYSLIQTREIFFPSIDEMFSPTSQQYRAKIFLIKKLISSDFRNVKCKCQHFNSLSELPLWL